MAALNERNIARHLYNPFEIFVAGVGESQPTTPSFYTMPGITVSFNREFVISSSHNSTVNKGVLFRTRADLSSLEFRVGFSIQETTLNTINFVEGGTINSDTDEILLDGTHIRHAVWLESCFNDDNKIIRIIIPQGKSIDAVELPSGEAHVVHPVNFMALPDPNDPLTFPSIYIEP